MYAWRILVLVVQGAYSTVLVLVPGIYGYEYEYIIILVYSYIKYLYIPYPPRPRLWCYTLIYPVIPGLYRIYKAAGSTYNKYSDPTPVV